MGDVCTRNLLTACPDETIGVALRRMSARDIGRLPVVAPDEPGQLLGMLRRADIVRAYDLALTKRAAMRHRAHQVRLGAFTGVGIEEIVVTSEAWCANKRLSEVPWPRDSVIATIRRGRQVLIPRGDTVLKVGDVLVVVAEDGVRDELRRTCLWAGQKKM